MEDTLINFETAKLAREKGFDFIYIIDNELTNHSLITQSLLAKWLREVHKIHIEVRTNHKWNVNIITLRNISGEIKSMDSELHKWNIKTYEEALEIGLYQALLLI